MKQYLCAHSFCQDKKYIWTIDFIIRGLFQIDKKSFLAECMLPPGEIYGKSAFDIQKLLDWDDRIVMLPSDISENWLIFYKNTREIERFRPVKISFKCADAFRTGDKIICIPTRTYEPIAVVDMKTRKCINLIEQWAPRAEAADSAGQIWNAVSESHRIYFPVRGFCFVGMTDGIQTKVIKLDLNSPIAAADFYKERWWVLTADGRSLYCFAPSGEFLEAFPLKKQFKCARLIVTDRYVFILPGKGQTIGVFDLKSKEIEAINAEVNKLPEQIYIVSYWHYYRADNKLVLLPHNYPCTVVNLDNLSVEHKEIFYTEKFVKEHYWKHYRDFRLSFGKTYFTESRNTSMQDFMKFTAEEIKIKKDIKTDDSGLSIWAKIKES